MNYVYNLMLCYYYQAQGFFKVRLGIKEIKVVKQGTPEDILVDI